MYSSSRSLNSPSKAQRIMGGETIPPPSSSRTWSDRRLQPQDEEPQFDADWSRKLSRQRRFTATTLPQVHERENMVKSLFDVEDTEREENLNDMSMQLDDMSGFVDEFVRGKEEEIAEFEEMFDEHGNPIDRFDEDGNKIPWTDEDGYSFKQPPKPPTKLSIKFKSDHIVMPEGWLYKKGAGVGTTGRRNWTKRYFKIDMSRPLDVYVYHQAPEKIPPRDPEYESAEAYKRRKAQTLYHERRKARAKINLDGAEIFIPFEPRDHKNSKVDAELEFDIVQPHGGRVFQVYAESPEDMEKWIRTFEYIISTIADAKANFKKAQAQGSTRNLMEIDEHKRDAAQACTAFGRGLFEAVAGQRSEFTIQGTDLVGTPDEVGGRVFGVVLESQDLHYDLDVVDAGDGTYSCSYVPTRVGTYELSILLDDYDVAGSPFHPSVKPAPVSAPHCVAEGAGLFCAVVGMVNQFTIQTRNSFNQAVDGVGVPFVVTLSPPLKRIDEETCDNGDGTYSIRYVVDVSDDELEALHRGEQMEADISVTLNDGIFTPSFARHIKGSSFKAVLAASATGAALAAAARNATMHMPFSAQASLLNQFASMNLPSGDVSRVSSSSPRRRPNTERRATNNVSVNSAPPKRAPPSADNSYLPMYASPTRPTATARSPSATTPSAATAAPTSVEQQAMLAQKAQLEKERRELVQMRRELEEGRAAVDQQVHKLSAASRRAQETSDDFLDRARTIGSPHRTSHHSPLRTSRYNDSPHTVFSSPRGVGRTPPSSVARRAPHGNASLPKSTRAFDASVMSLFQRHSDALGRVYRHYAAKDGLRDGAEVVRMPGFVRLAQDYDITPTFVSRKELVEAFGVAAAGSDALSFTLFCEALGHVAISALSKPMFAHLYSTPSSKVNVLLEIWGVADPQKLEASRRRDAYR